LISLRESRRELYIPCTMTSNNAEWERGWFYLRNNEPSLPPPFTRKVLKEKADSWWHGLSPSSRQDRLESALLALKSLADAGLGEASVLANLHHRRIVPLMEWELRIYEMSEVANPVSLARSRFLSEHFPQEYAATRARRAISLKAVRHSDDNIWSFIMLPDAPPGEWVLPLSPSFLRERLRGSDISVFPVEGNRERCTVRPAHTPSSSARAAQRQQQMQAARRERRIRRRERQEQRDEEFRLREQ
jgi:hypothetical protein